MIIRPAWGVDRIGDDFIEYRQGGASSVEGGMMGGSVLMLGILGE